MAAAATTTAGTAAAAAAAPAAAAAAAAAAGHPLSPLVQVAIFGPGAPRGGVPATTAATAAAAGAGAGAGADGERADADGRPAAGEVVCSRPLHLPPPPEAVDDTPHSWAYTGRHDSGPLPAQRTDTMYGHLVDALAEAKTRTDAIIVALVAAEAAAARAAPPAAKVSDLGNTFSNTTMLN